MKYQLLINKLKSTPKVLRVLRRVVYPSAWVSLLNTHNIGVTNRDQDLTQIRFPPGPDLPIIRYIFV